MVAPLSLTHKHIPWSEACKYSLPLVIEWCVNVYKLNEEELSFGHKKKKNTKTYRNSSQVNSSNNSNVELMC